MAFLQELYSALRVFGFGNRQVCLDQVMSPSFSWPFVLGQTSPLLGGMTGKANGLYLWLSAFEQLVLRSKIKDDNTHQ